MDRDSNFIFFVILIFMISISCRNPTKNSPDQKVNRTPRTVAAEYHGNQMDSQYDSIVNHLTLYTNESFDLHQVDRIAEHHLNERDHEGIYAYLADSTRLGLYSEDGYLMLLFLLTDDGMTPMIIDTDKVIDSSNIWKRLEE